MTHFSFALDLIRTRVGEGGQDFFESATVDDRGRRCFANDSLQKGAFAPVGLDEMDFRTDLSIVISRPRKGSAAKPLLC